MTAIRVALWTIRNTLTRQIVRPMWFDTAWTAV